MSLSRPTKRVLIGVTLLFAATPFLVADTDPNLKPGKKQQFEGKVVPLEKLLKKIGSNIDREASPHWLALVTKNGTVYPLVRDDGGRMFFNDPKVQNRPMKVTGRLLGDTHLLQVLNVLSYRKGKLHDIYYWCDICAIRRNWAGECECCGGKMFLKEEPVRAK